MDVMHGVLIALVVAAGAAAAVCWRGWRAAQAAADGLRASEEEARRVGERARIEADGAARELERARAELGVAADRERESLGRVMKLSEELAALRERLDGVEKVRQELIANEGRMREAFEAIGSKTVRASQETLGKILNDRLAAADEKSRVEHEQRRLAVEAMVKPIGETLAKTSERLTQLDERVKASGESADQLKEQTARLARALSRPEVRGKYGEIQLKRVAELAGMTNYCDFTEQTSTVDADGTMLRPDMVVTLPNKRMIAVDAKANIDAYMAAVNASDDQEREAHLERFARHISEQAKKLGDKRYWTRFEGSPEFVVMFVPGDQFIDAALSRRPELLDRAAQDGVILASPSTLIGLLRAVAVGWREHRLAEEAQELLALGKELHDRAAVAFNHAAELGDTIRQSVERYNKLVGSIDSRLVPTLKRFEAAGAGSGKELAEAKPVLVEPRALFAGEGEG
jgi:DNA recombination protein RmuC